MYLIGAGHDVRDVCPTRTAEQSRRRRQGKSDALDSVRIARETQADADIPVAFKRAAGDAGPDETTELIALWHQVWRSLLKSRQHLLNEAEALLCELPEGHCARPCPTPLRCAPAWPLWPLEPTFRWTVDESVDLLSLIAMRSKASTAAPSASTCITCS